MELRIMTVCKYGNITKNGGECRRKEEKKRRDWLSFLESKCDCIFDSSWFWLMEQIMAEKTEASEKTKRAGIVEMKEGNKDEKEILERKNLNISSGLNSLYFFRIFIFLYFF